MWTLHLCKQLLLAFPGTLLLLWWKLRHGTWALLMRSRADTLYRLLMRSINLAELWHECHGIKHSIMRSSVLPRWLVFLLLDLEEIIQRLIVLQHSLILFQRALQVEDGCVNPMEIVDIIDVGFAPQFALEQSDVDADRWSALV